jgi:hypothetical protein
VIKLLNFRSLGFPKRLENGWRIRDGAGNHFTHELVRGIGGERGTAISDELLEFKIGRHRELLRTGTLMKAEEGVADNRSGLMAATH